MSTTATTEQGTYSDGSRVEVIGHRNGFTYITFLDGRNKGITTKVPASWVTEDQAVEPEAIEEAAVSTELTTADIERMRDRDDWAGHGYLSERNYRSPEQVAAADAKALDAANKLGLTYEELFDWANSKLGRWFADCMFGSDGRHADLYLPGTPLD